MTACALDAFLIPNKIAAGGVVGSRDGHLLLGARQRSASRIPVGIADARHERRAARSSRGASAGCATSPRRSTARSALSVLVDVLAPFTPHLAADDLLLAALWGGAIVGPRHGARLQGAAATPAAPTSSRSCSRGGSRSASARSCSSSTRASPCSRRSQFGPNLALYGVVAIFVATATIDLVLEGVSVEKAVWIISDCADAHRRRRSTHEHGPRRDAPRGDRRLHGRDARHAVRGARRATRSTTSRRSCTTLDPTAMVIISNVHEAIGEGFKEMAG